MKYCATHDKHDWHRFVIYLFIWPLSLFRVILKAVKKNQINISKEKEKKIKTIASCGNVRTYSKGEGKKFQSSAASIRTALSIRSLKAEVWITREHMLESRLQSKAHKKDNVTTVGLPCLTSSVFWWYTLYLKCRSFLPQLKSLFLSFWRQVVVLYIFIFFFKVRSWLQIWEPHKGTLFP